MIVTSMSFALHGEASGHWATEFSLTNEQVGWITGLMAVGRQFAGTFVHRLSPAGMLFVSAVVSVLGLYAMSHTTARMLFASATIFAFGVTFFWPTMLGNVSERFPRTGALGLAIMGGAGMLSVSFVLPVIGKFYDQGIAQRVPADQTIDLLKTASAGTNLSVQWANIHAQVGLESLGKVGILPVILAATFLVFWLFQRRASAN